MIRSTPARAGDDIGWLAELTQCRSAGGSLVLLLDYDGTLVPIADRPELATPDRQLLTLLQRLAERPRTTLHIVSGRPRDVLGEWFGHLDVGLWAEHGAFYRAAGTGLWSPLQEIPDGWATPVLPLLERAARTTPGTFVEMKSSAVAWHYRLAEPLIGEQRARDLADAVGELAGELDVVRGKKVVEVRLKGITKALAADYVRAAAAGPQTILAIGDDATDDDLFAALEDGVTVAVGDRPCRARYRAADVGRVRELLDLLLA